MSALKIKKDDMVRIISGDDKDREGRILAVDHKKNTVIVENCNMVKKHVRKSAEHPNGGIVSKEAPMNISKVMLLVDGQATRVGFRIENGKKVRYAKSTGKTID